jgi:hypothetical protein
MSLLNESLPSCPFDATSDAKEPLIATGDVEEEDQGLEKNRIISTLSLCSWD